MTRKIAIIGDHFILPEVFESELLKTCFEYNAFLSTNNKNRGLRWIFNS